MFYVVFQVEWCQVRHEIAQKLRIDFLSISVPQFRRPWRKAMSLKGLDAGLDDDAPSTSPRPRSPQGGNGDEALGAGANNGKVARRTPRTRDEFVEAAIRIRAEAAKCVSTSWMKWTPEPAKAYPRYRQAGHLAPIEWQPRT